MKISPVFGEKYVLIVFAIDDDFAFGTSVMIQSIIANSHSEYNYDIVILHKSVREKNQKAIKQMEEGLNNFSIRFYNVEEYSKKYKVFHSGVSEELYYRLLIPELMLDYKKAFYVDGDMIALCDIQDFDRIDVSNVLFSGVKDICGMWRYYTPDGALKDYLDNDLELKNPEDYINAGFLIMNLELIREKFGTDGIWKLVDSRKAWLHHDQDIVNKMGDNNILVLPYSYNMVRQYTDEALEYMPSEEFKKWQSSMKDIKIIHFAGQYKPWKGYKVPGYDLFWKYAIESPLLQSILVSNADDLHEKVMIGISKKQYGGRQILEDIGEYIKGFLVKK